MSNINLDTPFQLTTKQISIAIAAMFAGAWALLVVTTSSLRDDVSTIRKSVQTLQVADKDGAVKVKDTELNLSKEISALRIAIEKMDSRLVLTGNQLGFVGKSVGLLESQIAGLRKDVSNLQIPPPR